MYIYVYTYIYKHVAINCIPYMFVCRPLSWILNRKNTVGFLRRRLGLMSSFATAGSTQVVEDSTARRVLRRSQLAIAHKVRKFKGN